MKVEMANQRSHAFPTATTCREKKTNRSMNNNNNNKTFETMFSTEWKSAHLFIGSMSAQENDTQCQRCGAEFAIV